jgi:ATP-dependent Lon protease
MRGSQSGEQDLKQQVDAIVHLLNDIYGSDKIILKATKIDAIELLTSDKLEDRVLALKKLILHNPALEEMPEEEDLQDVVDQLQDKLTDFMAQRFFEDELDKKIQAKMEEKHDEYIKELKLQLLKEDSGIENPQTLKRLALLEKKGTVKLAQNTLELLRPKDFTEIIGQENGIKGLVSKVASPFPQHMIIYGPPGVGKTTAARLALEKAKTILESPFKKDAPFIEVDGTTLRWDPRDITNPLIGSVHDPIYQGSRKDFADTGVPEPKTGLVTDAHGGILFIDEIGEMDPMLLNKLLKVLEDKKVNFESAYYDAHDPNMPQYVKKLFEEGAPADFILIGATTRAPKELVPALRSRCAEIFFEPLTPEHIKSIVKQAADKLEIHLEAAVPTLIGDYTIEGRKANNILADAYALALYGADQASKKALKITKKHIKEVAEVARLTPCSAIKGSQKKEIGKVFGLGVYGFLGQVIEIEALAFQAQEKGKGSIRFNETAGSMAKDSLFNAQTVVRKISGVDLRDFDLHVNVIGGGNIDGPSAGAAICLAIISAIQQRPIRQDVAITGEISLNGHVKPVGGIPEKIYGARQAGMKTVLIPKGNAQEINTKQSCLKVIQVETIEEVLSIACK